MKFLVLMCLAVQTVPKLEAGQLCQPDSQGVRRYNGQPCASTTRYDDGHKGACGCGPASSPDTPFDWNMNSFTTAPSERYFDKGGSSLWCGGNCGKCVKLTPTGGFVPGKGNAPPNHNPVIFLVTNVCPINGNQEWCGINGQPGTNQHNTYGYEVHFDLQNHAGQVSSIGWDNPEVTWEEVACPSNYESLWHQCQCTHSSVQTDPVLETGQLCQPDSQGVRRYNGKPCASTTRYDDGHKGACGCGPASSPDTPFDWNMNSFTTAPSERYFDKGGSSLWCGGNCGKCVKLTPTGGFVPGKGNAPPNHNPVIFLVTNVCPINGNQEWCGINGQPGTNQHNTYGYEVHFDLQNHAGQVSRIGWDNPEVTWEEVSCPSDLHNDYSQCQCH